MGYIRNILVIPVLKKEQCNALIQVCATIQTIILIGNLRRGDDMKLKARGRGFEYIKDFKNDNCIILIFNLYRFGLGIDFLVGDSRRFLTVFIAFIRIDIWF
jgi:hypothetical protein